MKRIAKINQEKFRIQSVIKIKCNESCLKRKCYFNSFNSWIDKKDKINE